MLKWRTGHDKAVDKGVGKKINVGGNGMNDDGLDIYIQSLC